jgi:hypothetical protein
MYCQNCNATLVDTDAFCPNCGKSVDPVTPSFPEKKQSKPGKFSSGPRLYLLVFLSLGSLCGLLYAGADFFADLQLKSQQRKSDQFQSRVNQLCQAAESLPVTPGEVFQPVYGKILDWPLGNEAVPYGVWDQRLSSYLKFDGFLETSPSQRQSYSAQTILCLRMEDIYVRNCIYEGDLVVSQYQQNFQALLLDYRSGARLGKQVFTGQAPPECPAATSLPEGSDTRVIYALGDTISMEEMLAWIDSLATAAK